MVLDIKVTGTTFLILVQSLKPPAFRIGALEDVFV
jgi:hypothetical protein